MCFGKLIQLSVVWSFVHYHVCLADDSRSSLGEMGFQIRNPPPRFQQSRLTTVIGRMLNASPSVYTINSRLLTQLFKFLFVSLRLMHMGIRNEIAEKVLSMKISFLISKVESGEAMVFLPVNSDWYTDMK